MFTGCSTLGPEVEGPVGFDLKLPTQIESLFSSCTPYDVSLRLVVEKSSVFSSSVSLEADWATKNQSWVLDTLYPHGAQALLMRFDPLVSREVKLAGDKDVIKMIPSIEIQDDNTIIAGTELPINNEDVQCLLQARVPYQIRQNLQKTKPMQTETGTYRYLARMKNRYSELELKTTQTPRDNLRFCVRHYWFRYFGWKRYEIEYCSTTVHDGASTLSLNGEKIFSWHVIKD